MARNNRQLEDESPRISGEDSREKQQPLRRSADEGEMDAILAHQRRRLGRSPGSRCSIWDCLEEDP